MNALASAVLRVVLAALAVDVVVAFGVLALGLALGWDSREAFAEALGWSGLLAMGVGGLAVRGGWMGRGVTMGFAASVGSARIDERALTASRDVMATYRLLLFLLLVGGPLVLAAVWLDPRV